MLMGSIGGRSALLFLGPYAASKHALEALADSLRVEPGPWGWRSRSSSRPASRLRSGRSGATRADELRDGFPREAADLYETSIARFREVALARGPGADPDLVARAVEHALTSGRPKPRYVVGRDAHVRAWIERLPTRLRDRVLARVLTG